MKEIIDIVHKSILPFFDVCEREEEPLSDKDKLLLKVNKAICNNLKALKREPCDDAISRQAVDELSKELVHTTRDKADFLCNFWEALQSLPPVTPQPKMGYWRHYENMLICSECGAEFYDDIMEYCGDDVPKCCPNCGNKKVEPQESEGLDEG